MLRVFGTGKFGSHESSHDMPYRLTLALLVLVALNGSYPVQWNFEKNLGWKVGLPGAGCSTPVVWNDSIIVTS